MNLRPLLETLRVEANLPALAGFIANRDSILAANACGLRRVSRLLADKGYKLEVTEAAREYLAEVGYDPQFGARPLKRAIQRELQDPLALKILAGEFKEGDTIKVDRGKEGLTFTADVPVVEGEVVA